MSCVAVLGPLTKEEESLKRKYAVLRQKKAEREQGSKPPAAVPVAKITLKRALVHHPVKAKETAKKVFATEKQQLSSIKESGFKRSKNLEKRLKEQHQLPQYQPWANLSSATEKKSLPSTDEQKQTVARYKGLYDSSFVPAASRGSSLSAHSQLHGGQRGNTVFIRCRNANEETLKRAFNEFGKMVEIVVEPVKEYAFITYDSVESAEKAIKQMDNGFLAKTRIRVSFARKQPSLTDTPEEPSTESVWNMGSSSSRPLEQNPSKAARKPVVYDDDFFLDVSNDTE